MQFQSLFDCLQEQGMSEWQSQLDKQLQEYFANINHGDYPKWQQALNELPSITPSRIDLNQDTVVIGDTADINDADSEQLINVLKTFMPWRKGPFNLFGIDINAEWRSNLKWARLKDKIKPLKDRLVLDIGCGNGYYGWRMLGHEARYVVGMDPTLLFLMQFYVFKRFMPESNIDIVPFAVQSLPEYQLHFDTVFSLGVIYHRRDPLEHLLQLKNCLKPGGELVLETLVIESDDIDVLRPEGRYAKMNNVWAIPNLEVLTSWVEAAGFKNARIIDVTKTTDDEQRVTEWMQFESLTNFLDKDNSDKTIEGYPAPRRAILLADN